MKAEICDLVTLSNYGDIWSIISYLQLHKSYGLRTQLSKWKIMLKLYHFNRIRNTTKHLKQIDLRISRDIPWGPVGGYCGHVPQLFHRRKRVLNCPQVLESDILQNFNIYQWTIFHCKENNFVYEKWGCWYFDILKI